MTRAEVQSDEGLVAEVAVLNGQESNQFFGVPMARRGIQPVWLHITNKDKHPYRLLLVSLDPNYFSALEAAFVNHFATGKRLVAFGLLGLLHLPITTFESTKNLRYSFYIRGLQFRHFRTIHGFI